MKRYYQVSKKGSTEIFCFDDLDEAIDFATESGLDYIAEIGGKWSDFEKCSFCGEWLDCTELNEDGICWYCDRVIISRK